MRVNDIVSRATTTHPHSPKGHLPKAAIPPRESLNDGGLMPVWLDPPAASVKLIAEYDSRTFNMGLISSFWDDRIEAMFELMAMKWGKFGGRYKLVLKKASDK